MSENILSLRKLTKKFKGVTAVEEIDAEFETGKIYGLIGTNGAGKSTVINMISGNINPTSGEIIYRKHHIEKSSAHIVARAGVARTFQNLRIFNGFTVLENVITARQLTSKYGFFQMLFFTPKYRNAEKQIRESSYEILKLLKIEKYADYKADSLPYGLQRRLEIARCLAINPKLLLLDEPAAGMNPQESMQLVDDILELHKNHPEMTVILVEHDMKVVMSLCEYIYVMASGKIIFRGTPDEVRASEAVQAAYLGGGADA